MGLSVQLGCIGRALGGLQPIDVLPELATDPQGLETLRALGLGHYSGSDERPAALAVRAARRTLSAAPVAPSQIDALIYTTTTLWSESHYRDDARWLSAELGLEQAYPFGLYLSECAGLPAALRLAHALIRAEEARTVLVVVVDCARAARVMPASVSVLSDGAASCLVSASVPGSFEILSFGQAQSPAMWNLTAEQDLLAFLKGTMDGLWRAVEGARVRAHVGLSDIRRIVTNNYNLSVQRTIRSRIGARPEQMWTANVARYGHVFAADGLINLEDGVAAEGGGAGLYLLLGSGHNTWGAVVLRHGGLP